MTSGKALDLQTIAELENYFRAGASANGTARAMSIGISTASNYFRGFVAQQITRREPMPRVFRGGRRKGPRIIAYDGPAWIGKAAAKSLR